MTTPHMSSIESLFARAAGVPSAFDKDSPVGTTVSGVITDLDVRQRNDLDGKPQFWDDGNPQEVMWVTLQVQPANGDDDGKRRFYAKTWGDEMKAIVGAVRKVGAPHLEVGGTLTIRYDGEGEQTRKGYNAPKLYSFGYERANPTASLFNKGGVIANTVLDVPLPTPTPQPKWQDPNPPYVPEKAAETAIDGTDPRIAVIRTLAGHGLDAGQISAAVPGFSAEAIVAVLALV